MEEEPLQHWNTKQFGNAKNEGEATDDDGGKANESSTLLDNVQIHVVEACWDEVY